MIEAAAVVIPVHDEEDHLEGCLESVAAACAALGSGVATRVVVVLDACNDASASIAARFAARTSADVVTIAALNVGRARSFGFEAALRAFALPAEKIWLATTDADTLVPVAWLGDQVALAAGGAHAMVGTIRVREIGASIRAPVRVHSSASTNRTAASRRMRTCTARISASAPTSTATQAASRRSPPAKTMRSYGPFVTAGATSSRPGASRFRRARGASVAHPPDSPAS